MGMREVGWHLDIWVQGIRDLESRLLAPREAVSMHPVSAAIKLTGWVLVWRMLK